MKRFILFLSFFLFCKYAIAQNCTVNAGIDETFCLSDNVVLHGTKGGLFLSAISWTQISGSSVTINPPSSLAPQITGFSSGTFKFSISATCADGTKASDVVTITILNSTTAKAGADIGTCPTIGTLNLAGNAPAGGETGLWTIVGVNAGSISINNTSAYNSGFNANYANGGVTTLRWTITNVNGCATSDDIIITNFGGSAVVSAGPDQILNGCYTTTTSTSVTGSFCGTGLGGQSGTWSVVRGPNMPNISTPNAYTTTITNLITGTYTFLYDVSGPCLTGKDSMKITVPPPLGLLSPVIANSITLCDRPSSVVLTGSTPIYINDTCRWVQIGGPSVAIMTPNNSPSTSVSNLIAKGGNVYSFRYFIANPVTKCSNSVIATITYIDTPFIMAFNDRVLPCNQDSVFLPYIDTGGLTYRHTLLFGPYPGVQQSQFNKRINFYDMRLPGIYTFNISRQSGNGAGCVNASDEVNVIVSMIPSFSNAGSDQILNCSTDSTEIVGNLPVVGFGNWSQVSGPAISDIDDSSNNLTKVSKLQPGKYKYRWLINGGQTCTPKQDDVNVLVSDSIPKYVNAGADRTICYGGSIRLNGNVPDSNALGKWRVVPDSGIVFSDTTIYNPFVSGLAKSKVYLFIWKIYNACGEGYDTVQITTDSSLGPKAAFAGIDQCLADTATSFYFNANTPWPGVGQWYKISGPSSNIISDTSYNSSVAINQPGNYVYEWVISRGTCSSNRDTVVITASKPTSLAFAGIDIDTCSKNAVMNANKPLVGKGNWSLNIGRSGGIIVFPDSANTLISNLTTGTYYYTWTISNGACAKYSDDVRVNISEPPTTPVAEVGKIWCNPSTIDIKANSIKNGRSYWSLNGINPNTPLINRVDSPNAVVSNFVSGIYHFKWNAVSSFGICPNQYSYRSDTIVLSANAGSDKNLCNVYNAQLTGTIGSKGFWSKISGGSVVIDTTGSNSAIANNMKSSGSPYKFLYTIDSSFGCPGGSDSVVIDISDTARKANAGIDLKYCNRDTFFLNANNVLPDSGTWSIFNGPAGASISNIHIPNALLLNPGTGTYILQWKSNNVGCQNSDFVNITNYDSSVTALAGNDTMICPPTINLNASLTVVANASWRQLTGPNSAIINSYIHPKTRLDNLVQGTYEFEWRIDNGLCPATMDTVKISIPYDSPSPVFAGNDTILCNEDSMAVNASQPFIGSGKWTLYSGSSMSFQNDTLYNTKINSLTPGLRKLVFTVKNGFCLADDTVQIRIDAFPSNAVTGSDSQYCLYSGVVISANQPAVGTGKWSVLSGNGAIITQPDTSFTTVTGLNAGHYVFEWRISSGICQDKVDSVSVTVDSIPTLSNAGPDRMTCLDTFKFAGNVPASGIGTWRQVNGRNATTILLPNSDTSSVFFLDSGTYTYVWEIAKGGCKSVDTMRVNTVDPQVNDQCETPYYIADTGGIFYGDMCGAKSYGNEPNTHGYAACNTLFYRFRTPALAIKPKVLNINVQSVNNCNNGLRFSLFDSASCPGLGLQHDTTIILNSTGAIAFENLKSDQAYVLVIDENRNPCAKSPCNLSFNLYGTALPLNLISFDVVKSGWNQTFSQWEIVNDFDYVRYELWCKNSQREYLVQSIDNIDFSNSIHAYQVYDNEAYKFPSNYTLVAIDRRGSRMELAQKTVDDFKKDVVIRLFPNPVSDLLTIELNQLLLKNYSIQVNDATGKLIVSSTTYNMGNNRILLNCKDWPNGIYNLQLTEGFRNYNFKVVVIH